MNTNLICPLSPENLNKSASRIGATITALLLTAFGVLALDGQTWSLIILLAVVADYIIRVFTKATPPISAVAAQTAKALRLKPVLMNKGPKIFAWRIGFAMAAVALLALPFSLTGSGVIAIALAGFNVLDGVFNFCVGCYIYTYVVLPTSEKRGWVEAQSDPVTDSHIV